MSTRAERRHAAMMLRGTGRPVVLIANAKRGAGEVRFESWSLRARIGRAATVCAISWGLAVVSVIIPVLHFVLVPILLIAGPIAAFRRLRQSSGILGGEAACPVCGGRIIIEAQADASPFFESCPACRAFVRIEAVGAPPRPT